MLLLKHNKFFICLPCQYEFGYEYEFGYKFSHISDLRDHILNIHLSKEKGKRYSIMNIESFLDEIKIIFSGKKEAIDYFINRFSMVLLEERHNNTSLLYKYKFKGL